ncbi:MAG TPA: M28 family peptidase [Pyrinomonadaceae bacterium]|jgi:Zn-dependent M28 family amino/carboxypeptidase
MKNRLITAVLFVAFLSNTVLSQKNTYTNLFNEQELKSTVKFLSDDGFEGRAPGSRGGELAGKYIAMQLQRLGIKPGNNGSYFQPVSLVAVKADPQTKLRVTGGSGAMSYNFADEFVAFTGAQTEDVKLNAEMVFVGYGIDASEQKWNDFKGNKEDYRGKVLVMMVNDPPATAAEPNLFGGRALTYYGRWTYKFEQAARMGAAGVILIHTTESAGYGWNVVRSSNGSWRFDIARTPDDKTPFLQMRSWVTNETAKRIFNQAGKDLDKLREDAKSRDFTPVNLGLHANIEIKSQLKRVESNNVVGLVDGADKDLQNEYVVYSAHWDHLGVGEPNAKGDAIYNGALDNATGVTSLLGIAEAITKLPAKQRPRRSSVFLFTTAEEQGLLGAEWFAKHPIFPVDRIAADVNLDSVNVLGRVGSFSALGVERSSLNEIVRKVATERGLKLVPDAKPEQGLFFRSDHFPFAKVGIPSLNMEAGDDFVGKPDGWGKQQFEAYNAANYHQPSDEFNDAWDFSGLVQMAEISMAIGLEASNAKQLQRFNKTDEFFNAQPNR